jgi:hypothetical protein
MHLAGNTGGKTKEAPGREFAEVTLFGSHKLLTNIPEFAVDLRYRAVVGPDMTGLPSHALGQFE